MSAKETESAEGALDSTAPDSAGRSDLVHAVVHGKVRDAEGRAIAESEVTVSTSFRTESTMSDGEGAFELPLTWQLGTQPPRVTAVHRRFVPACESISFYELKERPARVEQDLVLKNGIALMGRAVSRSLPAGGAVVRIVKEVRDREILYHAASDGRFFIPLQGESRIDLTINHGELGYAERSYRCDQESTFDVGDIELSRCSLLSVRLVYPDGTGIGSVAITISSLKTSILDSGRGAAIWSGTTDQGGSLTLHGMERGRHSVVVPGLLRSRPVSKPLLPSASEQERRNKRIHDYGEVGRVSTDEPPATFCIAMHRVQLSFRQESGEAVPPESVALLWTAAPENPGLSKPEDNTGELKSGGGLELGGVGDAVGGVSITHRNTNMTDRCLFDRFIDYGSRWQVIAETLTIVEPLTETLIKHAKVVTRGSTVVTPVPGSNESRVVIILRKVKDD